MLKKLIHSLAWIVSLLVLLAGIGLIALSGICLWWILDLIKVNYWIDVLSAFVLIALWLIVGSRMFYILCIFLRRTIQNGRK